MDWFVMEIFADQRELSMMVNDARVLVFAEEMLALMEVFALRREQFLVSQTHNAVVLLLKFATRLLEQFVDLALKVFVVVKSRLQCVREILSKHSLLLSQLTLLVTNKMLNTFAHLCANFVLTSESQLEEHVFSLTTVKL
jgi:hypothetical protein